MNDFPTAHPTPGILPSANGERQGILILGMHRGGTSAMTRIVNLLGADLPANLMPATTDNPKGYWESTELMRLHDQLLASGGSHWDDWEPFPRSKQTIDLKDAIQAQLVSVLQRDFRSSRLFVIKDPRICRFVPVWLEVLQLAQTPSLAVLPLRHPFEVASSLYARDGIPFTKGCLLWLRHVVEAERATRQIPRAFVNYECLLADWFREVDKLVTTLGIAWPRGLEEAAADISEFLSAELHHHASTPQELEIRSDVVGWVRRAYHAMRGLAAAGENEAAYRELDQVRSEFDNACLAFGDLLRAERAASARHALATATVVTSSVFEERMQAVEQRMSTFDESLDNNAQAWHQQHQDLTRLAGDCVARTEQTANALHTTADRQAAWESRIVDASQQIEDLQRETARLKMVADRQAEWESQIVDARQQIEDLQRETARLKMVADRQAEWESRIVDARQQIEALQRRLAQYNEAAHTLSHAVSERDQRTDGEFGDLRRDLAATREGLQQLKYLGDHTLSRIENLQVRVVARERKSLRERLRRGFRKLRPVTKPVEKALRIGRDFAAWMIKFRWLRISHHDLRLPFYRKRLLSTGLFDPQWYLEQYPDVAADGSDPLKHWLRFGVAEGRNPNPYFDTQWYVQACPFLQDGGENPLVHYLRRGASRGLNPSPEFDAALYLARHPEVEKAGINPLVHYLKHGAKEQRRATPSRSSCAPPVTSSEAPVTSSGPSITSSDAPVTPSGPLVTVVVPTFNHGRFLRQRLDSIYGQTYRHLRVILLDDCSADDSRSILNEYQAKYPGITSCHFNDMNSGGVFRQWRKAFELASDSALIWIAESDDFCDNDFLEKLVPCFQDEAVMLAYSRVEYVNEKGEPHTFRFEDHISPHMNASKWACDYVASGRREVESALGIKNTIPNVSGVVFRTPAPGLSILEDESWLSMQVCGDWMLYLHLLAGGKLAYCARTTNYFRFHPDNASLQIHAEDAYYAEHEKVSSQIARVYKVPSRVLHLNRELTRKYHRAVTARDEEHFDRLFNRETIADAMAQRKPTIMISLSSFARGGGELMAIRLANELKRMGYALFVHCFDEFPDEPGVRMMLRNDIPVVRASSDNEILAMIEDLSPDVINTHHASLQHKIVTLKQSTPSTFTSVRHVATVHGMHEGPPSEYSDAHLTALLQNTDAWIYDADKNVKPFLERDLMSRSRFTKIPRGLPVPRILPISRADLHIEDHAFVLCQASPTHEEGWCETIAAVTRAREICDRPIHLVLLGTGPLYNDLSRQPLPSYLHLLGFTDDPCGYYAMSDMGILPSCCPEQSSPMSIIEAFVAGKPVIASAGGEIEEVMTCGETLAGGILPLSNGHVPVERLAELIAQFATDAARYRAASGAAARLAGAYTIENVADQYLQVFSLCSETCSREPNPEHRSHETTTPQPRGNHVRRGNARPDGAKAA